MALFLIDHQEDNRLFFDQEVSHHMLRSLRKQAGDLIHAGDGQGTIFTATIESETREGVRARIVSQEFSAKDWKIHVACSLIKKENRFENFLEKATEIGVHKITPLICERTLKPQLRELRARKIIQSAVQQSFNPYVPILELPVKLEKHLKNIKEVNEERFIATAVDRGHEVHLEQQYTGKNPVHILIGPEGDFTPFEVEMAIEAGWIPVSLGENRLRTETAAITVVQIIKSCYRIKNEMIK